MCGIYGEFEFERQINLSVSLRRLDMMQHRGPDGYGFEYGNFLTRRHAIIHNCQASASDENLSSHCNYFLGHRRLSIIDLNDNAFQPMESLDGMLSIVYNGEIYNYIELKQELEGAGCRFQTDHSDTEVLLIAYSYWGINCLEKLRGMFAFAIFDRRDNTVFLARDRIGKKPLYYELSRSRFAFSSELTPLLRRSGSVYKINPEALCFYIIFGYVMHPHSIIKGIHKLPPATYAVVDLNTQRITSTRYWDISGEEDWTTPLEHFVDEVDHFLTDAVAYRLRADVPVAAFISGGIDSTLVVKKIRENKQERFDIFGADFPQPERSERRYIEEVATRYDEHLNLSNIDITHMQNIDEIVRVFDEPFDGGSSIAVFDLFKEARKNYKVILTGDGGDEVFAGYTRYAEFPPRQKMFQTLAALGFPGKMTSLLRSLGLHHRKIRKLDEFIRGDLIANYLLFTSNFNLLHLVKEEFRTDIDQFSLFPDIKARIKHLRLTPVKALQYLEMNTILPGRMMYKVDRFSMFHGVEARAPFLDHKLVEMAFSIPEKFNIDKRTTKIIPKKILLNDFNKDFVYRKKQGFGNPLRYWFERSAPSEIFQVLRNKNSNIYQFIDYGKINTYFPQINTGYSGLNERQLWRFLVLGHYIELLNERSK
jgi:asparagine synthase (glutamine-hydrolysing)